MTEAVWNELTLKPRLFVWSEGLDEINTYCGDLDSPENIEKAVADLAYIMKVEVQCLVDRLGKDEDSPDADIVLSVKMMTDKEIKELPDC